MMSKKHGDFIWYELMTRDPGAAKTFYDAVAGWTLGEQLPGHLNYRMIAAGNTFVGGVFTLTEGVSFGIDCRNRAEVDYYREHLITGGGSPG